MNKRQRKKRARQYREIESLRSEVAWLREACREKDRYIQALVAVKEQKESFRRASGICEEKDRIIRLLLADIEAHSSDYHHRTDSWLLESASHVLGEG